MNAIFEKIESAIKSNNVVLYMKGTKNMPMCGFSGTVVAILNKLGVEFETFDVLDDEELRQGIKILQSSLPFRSFI